MQHGIIHLVRDAKFIVFESSFLSKRSQYELNNSVGNQENLPPP